MPTIVISAVVGTAVFSTLETQVGAALRIAVGLVSVTAAVLASLQTFYNFSDRADAHRVAGVKYKAFVRELEQILMQPIQQLGANGVDFNDLRKRLDDLELEAPVVPERIYRRIEERYSKVVFSEKRRFARAVKEIERLAISRPTSQYANPGSLGSA